MKVICVGDSNTWGYDPRSCLGGRYEPDSRWADILAAKTGWAVSNWGLNGRGIPRAAPAFPADTGALLVMLGTNDLLQGSGPAAAAERMEQFLRSVDLGRERLWLIAPPPLAWGEWVRSRQLIEDSRIFARCCRSLAAALGIRFSDAGAWGVETAFDGVHFTARGHRAFAAGLLGELPAWRARHPAPQNRRSI